MEGEETAADGRPREIKYSDRYVAILYMWTKKKKKRKEKILIYIPADSPRGSIGILIPNNILLQRTETTASPYSATELSVLPTATSTHRHEMTAPHLAVAGFTPL